jgi:hypothetical protein
MACGREVPVVNLLNFYQTNSSRLAFQDCSAGLKTLCKHLAKHAKTLTHGLKSAEHLFFSTRRF